MRTIRFMAAVAAAGAAMVVPMATPASAGGGACHAMLGGEAPTQATGVTLELKGACLSPTVLRVEPGTEVTFVNRDPVTHNLYGPGLAIDDLVLDQSAALRFDHPGTYPYACTFHPGMVGAVVVGDGRFATDVAAPKAVEPSTTTTLAPVPLAATRPLEPVGTSNATTLTVLVAVALTVVVGALGYRFGRRSAELGGHDRADG